MPTVTLKDLLEASVLKVGEEFIFKGEAASLRPDGTIWYQKKEFSSLSKFAKEVARHMGLSKHYNGWRVVMVRGRPVSQFRDFYCSMEKGEAYHFPPLVKPRKRRRRVDQNKTNQNPILEKTPPEGSCVVKDCMVCKWGPPGYFISEVPTWSDILQVVLYTLKMSYPQKDFFSLRDDIYRFLDFHWTKLCGKPRNATWRQTAKMTLAHSRYNSIFENGYNVYLRTGYWRLKKSINPYADKEMKDVPSVPSKRKINGTATTLHKSEPTTTKERTQEIQCVALQPKSNVSDMSVSHIIDSVPSENRVIIDPNPKPSKLRKILSDKDCVLSSLCHKRNFPSTPLDYLYLSAFHLLQDETTDNETFTDSREKIYEESEYLKRENDRIYEDLIKEKSQRRQDEFTLYQTQERISQLDQQCQQLSVHVEQQLRLKSSLSKRIEDVKQNYQRLTVDRNKIVNINLRDRNDGERR
eukprot:TRINITY_DN11049_c0_g1_i1.p1 TRINITY_DN11049_c0_g1~~TRINITY_DN11049_c0_g1_i1.p1  ORF type:complete len:467 (-),score=69.56 TRINITY_DN11049_c0_g1_i1:81-1481(-)